MREVIAPVHKPVIVDIEVMAGVPRNISFGIKVKNADSGELELLDVQNEDVSVLADKPFSKAISFPFLINDGKIIANIDPELIGNSKGSSTPYSVVVSHNGFRMTYIQGEIKVK